MQVAARQVRSGDRQRVLCIGGPTFYGAVDLQSAINTNSPMIVEQPPLGMGAYHMGAFYPSAYQRRFGATVEDFAASAVQDHDHASRNPYAHLRNTLTVEDVVNSRPLSSPMTMAMVCPVSTSANALLICSEAAAAEVRPTPPVLIGAMATSSDPYLGGGKSDFAAMENLSILARKVYRLADVYDPVSEFDVVEVFSPYAPMQPMQLEALGFAPPGGGIDLIRSGGPPASTGRSRSTCPAARCAPTPVWPANSHPMSTSHSNSWATPPRPTYRYPAPVGGAWRTEPGGTFFQFENLAVLERHERS